MKFETKNVDKFTLELTFTSTAKEYADAVDKAYEETKGKYKIQGFRPGKAPKKVIMQNYGADVFFQDAFSELADMAYSKFMSENQNINTYGEPSLGFVSFADDVVVGKITLKVLPEVELGAYKGLKVKAILNEYDPKMLDEQLAAAQQHHTHSHVAEGKKSEMGDIVVIDFSGKLEGAAEPFAGGTATDYELELGSHSFIDTFEDQLVGYVAGDKVEVNVTFPENYGAPELAGKKAIFDCVVKSVNTKHIPEINDELAKHVAGVETLEEWKKEIEAQIKHSIDQRNQTAKEDAILAAVVDGSKVEVPSEVVEEQLNAVMRDLAQRLAYQGMRLEDYATYIGSSVEELREERRDDAIRIAKTKQVLEALVRAEDMTVTDAEIDAKVEENAKMANKSTQEYKKSMDSRQLNYIYSDILMGKLMTMLRENNEVEGSKDGEVSKKPAAKKTATTQTAKTAEEKKPAAKKATTTKAAAAKKETAIEAKPAAKTTAKKASTTTAKKTATKTAAKAEEKPAAKKTCAKKSTTTKTTK